LLRSEGSRAPGMGPQYRHEVDDPVLEAALNAKMWTKRMEATAEKVNLKVMKERMGHEVHLRKRTVALIELITELLQKVCALARARQ
jgi:ribosomal protein L31E